MKKRGLLPAALLALVLGAVPALAVGSDLIPPSEVLVRWVDAKGNLLSPEWETRSEWTWRGQFLLLRTWIKLPDDHKAVRWTSTTFFLNPKAENPPTSDNWVAVETNQRSASGTLYVRSPDGAIKDMGFVFQSLRAQPYLKHHSNCDELGILSRPLKAVPNQRFLFTSYWCEEVEGNLRVKIGFSADAKWQATNIAGLVQPPARGIAQFSIPKPEAKKPNEKFRSLGAFQLKPVAGQDPHDFQLWYQFGKSKSRWTITPGLGATYLTYRQVDRTDLRLTQIGLTGKVAVTYRLGIKGFDLGASMFGTLASLKHSPATVQPSKYLGINARVGYQLPKPFMGANWFILGGWYYWSMRVSDSSYGISSLVGPQALIVAAVKQPNARAFSAYVKFAPISIKPGLPNLANHELAGGLTYQLTSPTASRAWMLTLDLSRTTLSNISDVSLVEVQTASLGIQSPL